MMKGWRMTSTLLDRLSIWQLLDEPMGDAVNAIAVNVHCNHLLHVSLCITSDNISDLIISFMKAWDKQESWYFFHIKTMTASLKLRGINRLLKGAILSYFTFIQIRFVKPPSGWYKLMPLNQWGNKGTTEREEEVCKGDRKDKFKLYNSLMVG